MHKPRVVWFSVLCRYRDGAKRTDNDWKYDMSKILASRRNEHRLIRNYTALIRILRCVGTNILWEWPLYTKERHVYEKDHEHAAVQARKHARMSCVVLPSTNQAGTWFRCLWRTRSLRHEPCSDSPRGVTDCNQPPEEIVGWLKEVVE